MIIRGHCYNVLAQIYAGAAYNTIADLIGGWGLWFDWSFGNAVAGLFIGLLPVYGAKIDEGVFDVKHAILYVIFTIIGIALGFGVVTPLLTVAFYSSELTITWIQAEAAIISDASVAIVIGLPVLFLLAKRNAKKTNLTKED